MNNVSKTSAGFIYLVLFSVLGSTGTVVGKIGLQQDVSPLELLTFRFVVGAAVLWVCFFCFKREAMRIDRAGLIGCMQVAIVNCGSLWTYFFALSYLDASLMLVVHTTALIPAVMLLLIIRGEFPSGLDLFRFVLALIGIYLFINLVGELNGIGIVVAILSAFLFALYMTIIQLRLGDYNTLTITLYITIFMSILFTMAYLANGYRSPQFDALTWGTVLWLGLVTTALARFFLFGGIQRAGSRQAALFAPLRILLAMFWAVLLLDELLTPQQWMGTFFVLASVGLAAKAKSDRVRLKPTKVPQIQSNPT